MSATRLSRKVARRIGENIRRRRRDDLRLTQEQLAEAAGGYESGYIGEIERAVKQPSLGLLLRIAQALDTSVSRLLEGVDGDPQREASRLRIKRQLRRQIEDREGELKDLLDRYLRY